MNKKTIILTLLVGFSFFISQFSYAQVSIDPVAQTMSYSHTFVNNDMVIFQHNGKLIDAYYTIQNVHLPNNNAIQNIIKLDYFEDEGRIALIYNGTSKISFLATTKSQQDDYIICTGVSQNINDNGFAKEEVLKLVASWK